MVGSVECHRRRTEVYPSDLILEEGNPCSYDVAVFQLTEPTFESYIDRRSKCLKGIVQYIAPLISVDRCQSEFAS